MSDIFEIERVLDTIVEKNVRYYFVRWKGYGPADDTWEPENNLDACGNVLKRFWKSYKTKNVKTGKKSEPQAQKKRSKNETKQGPDNSTNLINVRKSKKSSSSSVETERNKKISKLNNDQAADTTGDISKNVPQLDSSSFLYLTSTAISAQNTHEQRSGKVVAEKIQNFEKKACQKTETTGIVPTKTVAVTQRSRKSSSDCLSSDMDDIRIPDGKCPVVTKEMGNKKERSGSNMVDSSKFTSALSSRNQVVDQEGSGVTTVTKTKRERKRKNTSPITLFSGDASNNFKSDVVDNDFFITVKNQKQKTVSSLERSLSTGNNITQTDKPQKRKRTSLSEMKKEMTAETMPSQQLVSNRAGARSKAKTVKEIQEHIKKGIMLKNAMLSSNACKKSTFDATRSMFELGTAKEPSERKDGKHGLSKGPVPPKMYVESSDDNDSGCKFTAGKESKEQNRKWILSKTPIVSPKIYGDSSGNSSSGPKFERRAEKQNREFVLSKNSSISTEKYGESFVGGSKSMFEHGTGHESKEQKSRKRILSKSPVVSPKTYVESSDDSSSSKSQLGSDKELKNQGKKYILSKSEVESPKTYKESSDDSNRSKKQLGSCKEPEKQNRGTVTSKNPVNTYGKSSDHGNRFKFHPESSKESEKQHRGLISSNSRDVSPKTYAKSSSSNSGHDNKRLIVSPKTYMKSRNAPFEFDTNKNKGHKSAEKLLTTNEKSSSTISVSELTMNKDVERKIGEDTSPKLEKTYENASGTAFKPAINKEYKDKNSSERSYERKECKKWRTKSSGSDVEINKSRDELQGNKKSTFPKRFSSLSSVKSPNSISEGHSGKRQNQKGTMVELSETCEKVLSDSNNRLLSQTKTDKEYSRAKSTTSKKRLKSLRSESESGREINKGVQLKKQSPKRFADLPRTFQKTPSSNIFGNKSTIDEKLHVIEQELKVIKEKRVLSNLTTRHNATDSQQGQANDNELKNTDAKETLMSHRISDPTKPSGESSINVTEATLGYETMKDAGESNTNITESKLGKKTNDRCQVTLLSKQSAASPKELPIDKSADSQVEIAEGETLKKVTKEDDSFLLKSDPPETCGDNSGDGRMSESTICEEKNSEPKKDEMLSSKHGKCFKETPFLERVVGLPNKSGKPPSNESIVSEFDAKIDGGLRENSDNLSKGLSNPCSGRNNASSEAPKNIIGEQQEEKSTSEEWTEPPKLSRKSSSDSTASEFELKIGEHDDTMDSVPDLECADASEKRFSNKITVPKASTGQETSSLENSVDERSATVPLSVNDSGCRLSESLDMSTDSLPELAGDLHDTSEDIEIASRSDSTDSMTNAQQNTGFVVTREDLKEGKEVKEIATEKPEDFVFDPRKTIGFNEDLDNQQGTLKSKQIYSVKQRFISVKDLTRNKERLSIEDEALPSTDKPTSTEETKTSSNKYDKNKHSVDLETTVSDVASVVDNSAKEKLVSKESQTVVSKSKVKTSTQDENKDGDNLVSSSTGDHENRSYDMSGKRKHENLFANEGGKNKVSRNTEATKSPAESRISKEGKLTGQKPITSKPLDVHTSNLNSPIESMKMKVKDNVDKKKRMTALEKKVGEVKSPKGSKSIKNVVHKQPQHKEHSPTRRIDENIITSEQALGSIGKGQKDVKTATVSCGEDERSQPQSDNEAGLPNVGSFCKPPHDIDSYTNIDDKSGKENDVAPRPIKNGTKLSSVSKKKGQTTDKNIKSDGHNKKNTAKTDEKPETGFLESKMEATTETVITAKKQATPKSGGNVNIRENVNKDSAKDRSGKTSHARMPDENASIQEHKEKSSSKNDMRPVKTDSKPKESSSDTFSSGDDVSEKPPLSKVILNKWKEIKRKINVPKSSFTDKELICDKKKVDTNLDLKSTQKLSELVRKERFTFKSSKPEPVQLNQDKSSHKGIRLSPVSSEPDVCTSNIFKMDIDKMEYTEKLPSLVSPKTPSDTVSSEKKSSLESKVTETPRHPSRSNDASKVTGIHDLMLVTPKTPTSSDVVFSKESKLTGPTGLPAHLSASTNVDSLTLLSPEIPTISGTMPSVAESNFEPTITKPTETSLQPDRCDIIDIDTFQEHGSPELPNFHRDRFDDGGTTSSCSQPTVTQESELGTTRYEDLEIPGSPELPNFYKDLCFDESRLKHSRECLTKVESNTEAIADVGKDLCDENEFPGSPELPNFHLDISFDGKTEQPLSDQHTKVGVTGDVDEKSDIGKNSDPLGSLEISKQEKITDKSVAQHPQECGSTERTPSQKQLLASDQRNTQSPKLTVAKQGQETKIEDSEADQKVESQDQRPSPKHTPDVQGDLDDNITRTDSNVTCQDEPSNEDISFSDMIVLDEEVYHSSPDDFQYSSPDEFFVKDMIGESDSEEQISFINSRRQSLTKSKTIAKTKSAKRTATLIITSDSEDEGPAKRRIPKKKKVGKESDNSDKEEAITKIGDTTLSASNTKSEMRRMRRTDKESRKKKYAEEKSTCDVVTRIIAFSELSTGKKARKNKEQDSDAKQGDSDFEFDLDDYTPTELKTEKVAFVRDDKVFNTSTAVPMTLPLGEVKMAIKKGDISTVLSSLAGGLDIESRDNVGGMTLLMRAVTVAQDPVVKVLILRGANVNARDNAGNTPLMLASILGLVNIAKMLLDAGADVNAKQVNSGETSLVKACMKGYYEMVCVLLTRGADTQTRCRGFTVLQIATNCGHYYIKDLLEEHQRRLQNCVVKAVTSCLGHEQSMITPPLLPHVCLYPNEGQKFTQHFSCDDSLIDKTILLCCFRASYSKNGEVRLGFSNDNGVQTVTLNGVTQEPVLKNNRCVFKLYPKVDRNRLVIQTYQSRIQLVVCVYAADLKKDTSQTDIT